LLPVGQRHDGVVTAFKQQAAVDLVGEDHDVAIADGFGDALDVALLEHGAGGILRRVDDDELGVVGDQALELIDVEPELEFFAKRNRDRFAADEVDHRLVNQEARIRVNDFIPYINQRQHRKENNWLTTWNYNHLFGSDLDATGAGDVVGDGLAEVGQAGRRSVVGPAMLESVGGRVDDVGRRIEV